MAYTGIDKEIYDSGVHFRPLQEYTHQQWTAPEIMGQNTNAGIVNTQAAGSYMGYPSYEAWLLAQGGGGGGGDGPDQIAEDRFSMGMSPGAMGGKLPGFGNWAKRTAGTLGHIYSQLPTPGNLLKKGIRHWKEKRDIRREEDLQAEIAAHNQTAADQVRANQVQQNIQTYGNQDRPNTGMNEPGGGKGQSPTGGDVEGTPFAQGGRIGYNRGRVVNPGGYQGDEFEDENTLEFMRDQGVPYGEMAEKSPFEMRIDELMDTGMSWQEAYDIASDEFNQLAEGQEDSFSEEGLASLV